MFNAERYKKIFDTVRGDIYKTEELLKGVVPSGNSLYESLDRFVTSSSKRIRSVLAFLYLRACGLVPNEDTYRILSLVELIHNASLIHDDVIDNESKRRSVNTLNAEYDNKIAVISGDYLLAKVMKKLTEFGSIKLFEIFSETINSMCEGEVIQYINLNKIPDINDYLDKTYKKTGALFEASLAASVFTINGKICSNASEFGKNFGIAFQINDDLENIFKGAKDVVQGIFNAPIIFSESTNITESGIEKTKILLNNYLDNTRKYIDNFEDNVYKSMILELLDLFNEYRVK